MKNVIVRIYGREFILKSGNYEPRNTYENIFKAYEKPSIAKKEIWNDWVDWFVNSSEGNNDFISICSRNVYHFSINGILTFKGIKYSFLITSTKNEVYLIK